MLPGVRHNITDCGRSNLIMNKQNLYYVVRQCKNYAASAGWRTIVTDFDEKHVVITLTNGDEDPLNTTPQKLIKDLELLISCADFIIKDAVLSGKYLSLNIAPLPAGCTKKEVCQLTEDIKPRMALKNDVSEKEFDAIRQRRRNASGISNTYPERSN